MTTTHSPRLLPPADTAAETRPTPSAPSAQRPPTRGRRSWSAWLLLLAILAGAAYGGYRLVEHRLAGASQMALDRVTLVAQPVPVGSPDAAVVQSVTARPGLAVTRGDELAVIEVAVGGGGTETVVLTAPVDAEVVQVDAQPGSVVRAGESVVTLYEPEQLTFQTELPVEEVEGLQAGMTARISGPGLAAPTTAVVQRVVPVIDGAAAQTTTMTVILRPEDRTAVQNLVPGVPLVGTLDTASVGDGGSVLDRSE